MSSGWTKTPNEILELLSSFDSPDKEERVSIVEMKLTLCLVRQTFGWQQNQVRLTWEDIERLTSIKGRASIGKAIEAVEKRGFFIHGRKSLWSINSSKFELFTGKNSSNFEPHFLDDSSNIELFDSENSSNFELEESSNFEPFPFKEKKKEKENPPTPQTAVDDPEPDLQAAWDDIQATISHFEQLTGKRRPYSRNIDGRTVFASDKAEMKWLADWVTPAHQMKALANGHTDELMAAAYQELTGKGYTVASPNSLYATFCRLHNAPAAAVPGSQPTINDLIAQAVDEINAGIGIF